MKPHSTLAFFAVLFAAATVQPSLAQALGKASPDTVRVGGKVYTYVEQMPQLPGGGGSAAIISAIQSKVVYPALALQQQLQGRVFVNFTVGESGLVRDIKVVKGIGGGCDEAVVAAVQQLPQFIPGRQVGRPVPVSFTVPVTFRLQALAPPPSAPPASMAADTTRRIYTYVEQMPQLPGGGGNRAIVEAIQSHVIYPPEALKQALQGQVFVSFTVGEDGNVRDAKIVKVIGGGCDETVLAAVRQLPQFTPGHQAGKPVAVSYTVPVNFAISGPPAKKHW